MVRPEIRFMKYKNKVRYRRTFGHRSRSPGSSWNRSPRVRRNGTQKGMAARATAATATASGWSNSSTEKCQAGSIILRSVDPLPSRRTSDLADYTILLVIDGQVKFEPFAKGRRKKISVYAAASQGAS